MHKAKPEQDIAQLFEVLDRLPEPDYLDHWNNPRLLLIGAGYATGCARVVLKSNSAHVSRIEQSPLITTIAEAVSSRRWWEVDPHWLATHFLTNAVYRVCSATEKLVALILGLKPNQDSRRKLWELALELGPSKHSGDLLIRRFLGTHKLKQRWSVYHTYLDNEADEFTDEVKAPYPLLSCIYQADADKHRLGPPMPGRASYLFSIAHRGILQAGQIYTVAFKGRLVPKALEMRSRTV